MPKPKPTHDYTEAQELRNKGYSLVEISRMTGINRWLIGDNITKPDDYLKIRQKRTKSERKPKPKPLPKLLKTKLDVKKEAKMNIGFSHIHKAEVKMTAKDRVFPDRSPRHERAVVVNNKTTVFVRADDTRTNEQIINSYLRRIG